MACGSDLSTAAETVSVDVLAQQWGAVGFHGEASPAEVERFVREDIGAGSVTFYRCARCGLESADPRRTWRATHYPHEEHSLGWDHLEGLARLRFLRGRLLDIGCADGQFIERAKEMGLEPTGIDFSSEDVAAARSRGLDAHVADLSAARQLVDARGFDVITMFQVIEHLEQPDEVFAELARAAAPGATLLLGCPSDRRYTRRFAHPERIVLSDYWDYPPQHCLRWTEASLRAFLGKHGWEVEELVHEPLSIIAAAAHLTAVRGRDRSWYQSGLRRRLATLTLAARIAFAPATGLRIFVRARR